MTHLTIPVRKLAWGTDWHLNFLKLPERQEFIESLARTDADAFAITGDFTDGRNLERDLQCLGSTIRQPIFLLLGNHDRYHASFAEAEAIVQRAVLQHPQLHRLTGGELVELSPATALIGVDGWADGTAGAGSHSKVELNDTRLVEDLAVLPRNKQWLKMRELADGFARALDPTLHEAMSLYAEVIVLTHVPPLPEATWHEGRPSEADFLPHFCNPTLGRLLREACLKFPEAKVTVLCGHAHGDGVHREGNMTVWTGGAEYFKPKVDRVLQIA